MLSPRFAPVLGSRLGRGLGPRLGSVLGPKLGSELGPTLGSVPGSVLSLIALVVVLVSMTVATGCRRSIEGKELVAAKADLTTRQLVAGLNAQNPAVLRALIVVTSTIGTLRPPTDTEIQSLVSPAGPFEQLGAGTPGLMTLRDGSGRKQQVRLVERDNALKVLATKEPLAAYLERSGRLGAVDTRTTEGVHVLTIMREATN